MTNVADEASRGTWGGDRFDVALPHTEVVAVGADGAWLWRNYHKELQRIDLPSGKIERRVPLAPAPTPPVVLDVGAPGEVRLVSVDASSVSLHGENGVVVSDDLAGFFRKYVQKDDAETTSLLERTLGLAKT